MTFDLKKFDPQDADDFIQLALDGLGAIATLVGGNVGDQAGEILDGIKSIVEAIFDGYDGKATFAEVRNELKKFIETLDANDVRANAALARKFAEARAGAASTPKTAETSDSIPKIPTS
jgi:hypothetical protein